MLLLDRKEAGQRLLAELRDYRGLPNAIVLAIPRGGVELGYEVAKWLRLPLDIAVARKIGAPENPEFAIGAIAEDGSGMFDEGIIRTFGIPQEYINRKIEEARREVERRIERYRSGRPAPEIGGKTVLLVDDGIATGATVLATIGFLKNQGAKAIIVVAPVMSPSTFESLRKEADRVVCLDTPVPFRSVGAFYASFPQVSDEEVTELLDKSASFPLSATVSGRVPHTPEMIERSLDTVSRKGDFCEIVSETVRDRGVVLLGEASHGTHEYYAARSDISKELIRKHGFRFIAVEGDWPSCFDVNRYVKGDSDMGSAREVLVRAFERWPRWMWVNEEIEELVEWMREYNRDLPEGEKVGFYGLDVYSLWESLDVLAEYFKGNEEALEQIRRAYFCFEPYSRDEEHYATMTRFADASCEGEVIKLLEKVLEARQYDGLEADLATKMNATVVRDAERYYRSMMAADDSSWNIRDRHMESVLRELCAYFPGHKAIVWEHNTHVGDARATDMTSEGMVNVGELVRDRFGRENVAVVWFGSYAGSVTASRRWWGDTESMRLPEAKSGSWESLLHEYGGGEDMLLVFDEKAKHDPELAKWRGHRAVWVVYHPESEWGNYVPSVLPERYDLFWFIDRTRSLVPLAFEGETTELETFPSGV